MKIVNIVPLKKGFFQDSLTYFTTRDIENGNIVTINLRNKKVLGLVISSLSASEIKINIKDMRFNLKKIIEVKEKSIFRKEYMESIILLSKYFTLKKNNALIAMLPSIFRENYDELMELKFPKVEPSNTLSSTLNKSEKMILQETFENRITFYKTLIRENFAKNKSVFIVLPTELDIDIFEGELKKGIEKFTYTFHSGFSAKKIIEKFKKTISMKHPVLILGTVPFLSIPRFEIGAVVIEHESSDSYKTIIKPYFDMKIFAEIFASKISAKTIFGDNLLSFETIARHEIDRLTTIYPLSFRINFKGKIEIENPRAQAKALLLLGKSKALAAPFKIFSEKTIEEIKGSLTENKNVFIFTLRKGLATQTICRDCGETVNCEKCLAPLVLYTSKKSADSAPAFTGNFFVCNKCGEKKSGEITCTHCHSWNLIPLGIGTETITKELEKNFPKNKIFKLDKESVKNKKEAEKIITEFEKNPGSILVGTSMAINYLKNKVNLSIIGSFDSFWCIPNFKISEKIIRLVISILHKTENKFIIQTKNIENSAILAIQTRNLLSLVRAELEDRKNLSYPPFKRFIKIKHVGNQLETLEVKKILEENFTEYKPFMFDGFTTQIKDKYITNALIKMDPNKWNLPEISINSKIDEDLMSKLLSLPNSFEIFIDSENLF